MDSQLSGNNEIIFIETDEVYFSVKANINAIGVSEEKSLTIDCSSKIINSNYNEGIYFKEYQDYEIVIESKKNFNIEFYHDNINIRNKVTVTGRSGKILSGVINFRGDIGYSNLYILVNKKMHLMVKVEIFPTKINYREEYRALLSDINKEVYNLAYGFLSRTYLGSEIVNKNSVSDTEFYSILKYICDKLLRSIEVVFMDPHRILVKEERKVKYHLLRNSNIQTVKWIEKRPYVIVCKNNKYIPIEALQISKGITLNTRENKFLKFILIKIVDKIDGFIHTIKKCYWKSSSEIINEMLMIKKNIVKKINNSFLKNIEYSVNVGDISLVFSMGNGYKQVYKYYLMLQKGLNIRSNLFSISMKELPLLYEYWCFIKINALLKSKYRLISSDFIRINNEGICVALRKGKAATLIYENAITGERFKVMYNSKCLSRTVSQRPDNIISFDKEKKNDRYQFIFDAKYKIDTSNEYIKKYGGHGPKEEDINTMHRYRDAILYENKEKNIFEKCIIGAYVLFPYDNDKLYRENRFYKSIDEVNIGGIPFLPSNTKLMEEFLEKNIRSDSITVVEKEIEGITKVNV